jgi:hypothetical protein
VRAITRGGRRKRGPRPAASLVNRPGAKHCEEAGVAAGQQPSRALGRIGPLQGPIAGRRITRQGRETGPFEISMLENERSEMVNDPFGRRYPYKRVITFHQSRRSLEADQKLWAFGPTLQSHQVRRGQPCGTVAVTREGSSRASSYQR